MTIHHYSSLYSPLFVTIRNYSPAIRHYLRLFATIRYLGFPDTPSFWNSLFQRLTLAQIIPVNYKINITIALGLIPDSSKNHRQINFCLLLARHYIWTCKSKKTSPKIEGFLLYLKLIYLCEEKAGATLPKKWELLKTLT